RRRDIERSVCRKAHQRANQKCVDARFDHGLLILPKDIRRKATAPSKIPRRRRSTFPANPSAAGAQARKALLSLRRLESAPERAAVEAKEAATLRACALGKKSRTALCRWWKFPNCPGKRRTQVAEKRKAPLRCRKRRTLAAIKAV